MPKTTPKKTTTAKTAKPKAAPKPKAAAPRVEKAASVPAPSRTKGKGFPGAAWSVLALMGRIKPWAQEFGWDERQPDAMMEAMAKRRGAARMNEKATAAEFLAYVKAQVSLANKKKAKDKPAYKLFNRFMSRVHPLPTVRELNEFLRAGGPVVVLMRVPNVRLAQRFRREMGEAAFMPIMGVRNDAYDVLPHPGRQTMSLTTSELLACWHGGSPASLGRWDQGGKRWFIAVLDRQDSPYNPAEHPDQPIIKERRRPKKAVQPIRKPNWSADDDEELDEIEPDPGDVESSKG